MSGRKGAEIIVDYLVREKVPYAFGMCGHGDLGLLDALYDRRTDITTISVHHESVAGFMADAYFRVRHQPVVTFTSCGPGSANLPVSLGSALMDSSAFLAITGNVATTQFNRGPFQETGRHYQADFPSVVRPYVKRSFQATRPEQLPLMLRQAFATMTQGRPGPVHLDVPLDVFVETSDAEIPEPRLWRAGFSSRAAASAQDVLDALRMLLQARRPVIVAGHGVELADASAELHELATLLGIPVVHTPLGSGVIDARSPLSLGASGRNGTYQANRATRSADVILALGTRFDDRATSSWLPGYTYTIPPTRLIHVDIDPAEIGRNYPPTLGIVANAKDFLGQLLEWVTERNGGPGDERLSPQHGPIAQWRAEIAGWAKEWDDHIAPQRSSDAVPIRPERLLADLRTVLPRDGLLISDVGIHHNWIVQEWPAYAPRTMLQSWGFASMGFGVCGVLGAKLAAPERPVVAVVGDGGFLLMPSAVATAVEYDIPVVWVVWNNKGFISIRDQQAGYFGAGRTFATSFVNERTGEPYTPDFAAMARSMGADGSVVERPGDLAGQLEAAIMSNRPTVLDVRVDAMARPLAAATWDLPPLPHPEPDFGWPDTSSTIGGRSPAGQVGGSGW
jgi:acetolactate synthase-1/2/3 large subunit